MTLYQEIDLFIRNCIRKTEMVKKANLEKSYIQPAQVASR